MATFGENLRRERELRGVTLPQLASATKIGLRYLTALETNKFDRLPGGIFNRGFVRSVARYLELDAHFWVGEFVRAAGEEPEVLARYAPPQARPPARRGLWSFAVLAVVFAVAAYFVHTVRARRALEAANLSVPSAALPASAQPPEPAPREANPQPSATPAAVTPLPAPVAAEKLEPVGEGELQLQVDTPLEEAWVKVTADGRELFQGTMQPKETRRFNAAGRFEVTTGNAAAVVLTLNGETLAPLGSPGEVKSVSLTARDLRAGQP